MSKRKRLGEILLDAGVITPGQLNEALQDQKRYGGKLGTILLERRHITEKQFFHALSSQLRIPAIDFTKSTVPEAVIKAVPQDLAEKHLVFPVALKRTPQGRVLVLAMSDPTNVEVQDEVRFTSGYKVEPVLALESTIRYVIRDYFYRLNGQGSYRLNIETEMDAIPDTGGNGRKLEIVHSRVGEPDQPSLMTQPPGEEEEAKTSDRPKLTRELKALLKLLAKKGIITPKEYFDEFMDTE